MRWYCSSQEGKGFTNQTVGTLPRLGRFYPLKPWTTSSSWKHRSQLQKKGCIERPVWCTVCQKQPEPRYKAIFRGLLNKVFGCECSFLVGYVRSPEWRSGLLLVSRPHSSNRSETNRSNQANGTKSETIQLSLDRRYSWYRSSVPCNSGAKNILKIKQRSMRNGASNWRVVKSLTDHGYQIALKNLLP